MKVWVIYDSKYGNNEIVAKKIEATLKSDHDIHVAYAKKISPKQVLVDNPNALLFGGPLRFAMLSFTIKRWVKKFSKLLKKRGIKLQKVAAWGTHNRDPPNQLPRFTWAAIELKWKALRDQVPAEITVQDFCGIAVETVKGPMESGWEEKVSQFVAQF